MTIIVTMLLPGSVVQASDRLITTRDQNGFVRHDPAANKSIIYVGNDCRLVLGYTGPAYIDDISTDAWIAELLSGQPTPQQVQFGGPPRPALRAQSVLNLLVEQLPSRVDVSVGGYERINGSESPLIWNVRAGEASRVYEPGSSAGYTYGTLIPAVWQTDDDMRALLSDLSSAAPKDQDAALVRGIRRIAEHSPAVGGDVMVVEVAEEQRWIGSSLHVEDKGDSENVPLLFSPAAVFPGTILAPMQLSSARIRMVIQNGAISFGPIEDPENDCILNFNVNHPSGSMTFAEHVRAMPPAIWEPRSLDAAPAGDGSST